ncbi:uncharacterized protein LOC108904938 [Anoplophora glabripennis]|uniref:uncharacterized protein LOC108904938 n=1 Tax=Anoplophora glabripennis TaxID=217634 RepID=UPI000A139FAE|nr:uncharacterized protein LOC108904938 [Anoplophora glabripennis]
MFQITVCLANVLAAQAECCKCDCQQSGLLQQPYLYYLPVAPTHLASSDHGLYQNLGHASVQDVAGYTQSSYGAGYQSTGGIDRQYNVHGQGIENSLDAGSKLGVGDIALGLQETSQQPSFDYKGQGAADTELTVSNDNLKQQQISKVSTSDANHYIKIEQQVSPHDSSVEAANSLEHEKDHHHGKNDHYKFEYGVNDHHTHDIKSHKEEKNGDVVRGEYSLVEDNGNVRTVKYYADWKTGFHAQVHNSKSSGLSR